MPSDRERKNRIKGSSSKKHVIISTTAKTKLQIIKRKKYIAIILSKIYNPRGKKN